MNIHIDRNIGTSGAKVFWMRSADGKQHWCKMAISMFGHTNMSIKDFFSISPFDKKFNDNYVEGKGATKEEALANMEAEQKSLTESLWDS